VVGRPTFWHQATLRLPAMPRGFHLITREVEAVLPQLAELELGQLQIFIQHTSAGLTVNENADPSVRGDFARHFDHMVPEGAPYWRHTYEGPDDMPAHVKSSLVGSSLILPVSAGRLALGTWQGIYLCEFRDRAAGRRLVLTLQGRVRS
jgi:secondary thiamine-phosphate synthase enzyme